MIKKLLVLLSLITVLPAGHCLARDITLAWDANPEPDVAGYRIYYKANSSSLPLDGTGAAEGGSPIDVGNQATATLTGLPDGDIYYFAVTAYDTEGLESPISNVVATDWVPQLLSPTADETVPARQVVFNWSAAPAGTDVTYTLYFGANPALKPMLAASTFQGQAAFAGVACLGLAGFFFAPRRRLQAALLVALLAAPLFLHGCGGGGGGSDDPAPIADGTVSPDGSRATVQMVAGLAGTSHAATNLQPGTRYYWKVVATDANGNSHESVTGSFTTAQ
jgi:fibronectin type 3 domain-containing protein